MSGQDDLRGIVGISELAHERRDEVDLIDLWLIFVRYWVVFAAIVTVGVAAGIAYALLRTENYTYTTLIEIGTRIVGDETQLIESPDSVLAKVKDGYRLMELREYYAAHPEDTTEYDVAVSVPQKADLLVIEDRKPEDKETAVQAIHAGIVARLEADHNRIITVIRKQLESQLVSRRTEEEKLKENAKLLEVELERLEEAQANKLASVNERIMLTGTELKRLEEENRNRLAIVDERIELLRAELASLKETRRLVEEQIGEYQRLIEESERNRERAVSEATDEARAMTLMLINNEIQRYRQSLASSLERRDVALPNREDALKTDIERQLKEKQIVTGELANKRDELAARLDNLRRERQNLENELATEKDRFIQRIAETNRELTRLQSNIETLQTQLDNMRATQPLTVATQSFKPAGPGKAVVVILAGLVAGFVGLLAVIVLHMRDVVRRRAASV